MISPMVVTIPGYNLSNIASYALKLTLSSLAQSILTKYFHNSHLNSIDQRYYVLLSRSSSPTGCCLRSFWSNSVNPIGFALFAFTFTLDKNASKCMQVTLANLFSDAYFFQS